MTEPYGDDFDLDIRLTDASLAPGGSDPERKPRTDGPACPGWTLDCQPTRHDTCNPTESCQSCDTCYGSTCAASCDNSCPSCHETCQGCPDTWGC